MIDVVIVNWNAGARLRACLDSLRAAAAGAPPMQVVVVDNGSTDGSADGLEAADGLVRVVRAGENLGFARACNLGARHGQAEYLLFLNPDTIVNAAALAAPVRFLSAPAHASAGVCGLQLIGADGAIQRTCTRQPTGRMFAAKMLGLDQIAPRRWPSHFMGEWAHDETRRVDHVIGAFYVIRRAIFERLGGFDERFFVYLEDLDLSTRVRQLGHEVWYLTDATAFHEGGGTSDQVRARRLAYSLHSRIQYGFKHFTRGTAWGLCLGTLLIEPWIRLGVSLARGRAREARETAAGFAHLAGRVLSRGVR